MKCLNETLGLCRVLVDTPLVRTVASPLSLKLCHRVQKQALVLRWHAVLDRNKDRPTVSRDVIA
jgi:hypothetical protein